MVVDTLPSRAPGHPPAEEPTPGVVRCAGAGAMAALWAVALSLAVVAAPVLLAWLGAGAREPIGDALSVAATGWLLGLGTTLSTADALWGVVPLGLTAVLVVLASRATGWAVDASFARGRTALLVLVASFAGTGAALAGVAASLSTLPVRADPGEAASRALLVMALGAAVGLLREGHWRLTGWPGRVAPAALAALAVLVGAAAATSTLALVASFSTVMRLVGQIDPGAGGALALLGLSLAYLPTMVVWTLAVLAGPGLTLGSGVTVSLGGVTSGPLPGVPLLGAVPTSVPGWLLAVAAVTLLGAGVAAGVLLARRLPEGLGPVRAAAAGAATGLLAGAAVGIAAWAATGPLGPGELARVGTSPAGVTAVVALVVGGVAALVGAASAWRGERDPTLPPPPAPSP